MVRVTTQETFDSVVRENEEDLGLDHDEAVQDAIKQFEAQGVDLINIVTTGSSSDHAVLKILKLFQSLLENPVENINIDDLKTILNNLKSELDIDIARKVLAGKNNAYSLLVDALEKFEDNHDINHLTLNCLTSLMTGQPDLLDEQGVKIIMRCLNKESDSIKQQALRWTRQCCLKHESNRQMIMEFEIGIKLTNMMDGATPVLVRHACMVIRCLVLDDDIRVPFGKAHEHARLIACDYGGLKNITQLLNTHKDDLETVNELLSTLGALVVREEFCREVEECGGLSIIMDIMVTYPDDEKLNRQSLKLLKGLAGSDSVKAKIVQAGVVPLLISAMVRHQSSGPLFNIGCLAVAAIALRSPANSELLCDCGASEALLQGMREHANDVNTQKACSLAIRNIVARKRELCKQFLESGAEELLRAAIANHGEKCDSNVKDALRDLGCDVQLTERWTGKNTGITN